MNVTSCDNVLKMAKLQSSGSDLKRHAEADHEPSAPGFVELPLAKLRTAGVAHEALIELVRVTRPLCSSPLPTQSIATRLLVRVVVSSVGQVLLKFPNPVNSS